MLRYRRDPGRVEDLADRTPLHAEQVSQGVKLRATKQALAVVYNGSAVDLDGSTPLFKRGPEACYRRCHTVPMRRGQQHVVDVHRRKVQAVLARRPVDLNRHLQDELMLLMLLLVFW